MKKLGKFLVKKYVITEFELSNALALQKTSGADLPRVLLSEGYTNSYNLYHAIAEYEDTEFADLSKEPCDDSLLCASQRDKYLELNSIPWKKVDGKVLIATCGITDEVKLWASQQYGEDCHFVITSPYDIYLAINQHFALENDKDARERLWLNDPQCSARDLFSGIQSKIFLASLVCLLYFVLLFPYKALAYTFLIVNSFYIAALAFKALLLPIGFLRSKEVQRNTKVIEKEETEYPVYTILVPLYREEKTLLKLVKAIRAIDYPKSKLDVKLIVEEDDEITIEAIKNLKCERMFEMIKVPESIPRTKPKACNYALRFARGGYVTIYDAEDVPDPQQLRKVLYIFDHSPENVVCVQAKLNYFNREENTLTRMFAIEYSSLFDFTLFGLKAMNIPIPLGGTSNHFKNKVLQELYAWDPYNVTEDADLGVRIAQKGWKVGLVDSLTLEEAPINLKAWLRQRSRWIKGHMQTYFVHMRRPLKLMSTLGPAGFFGLQLFLGAPALIFLISPVMWLIWMFFIWDIIPITSDFPNWFPQMIEVSYGILIVGIALQIICAIASISYNKWPGMMKYSLLFPFYWVLHSVASFKSLWQLITKPYYWEKTNHGETSVKVAVESE